MRAVQGETQVEMYVVELETPEAGWTEIQALTASARQAAAETRQSGTSVRFVRSVFVPERDRCLFVYEAPSVEAVRDATSGLDLRSGDISAALPGPA